MADGLLEKEQEIRCYATSVFAKFAHREVEDVNLTDQILRDLGFDSLDFLEFVIEMEVKYEIVLDDGSIEKCITVKQMSDYIVKEVMNQKHGTELQY